jgi:hypothetical protein
MILEGTTTISGGTLAFGASEGGDLTSKRHQHDQSSAITGTGGLTLCGVRHAGAQRISAAGL